jgi:hypothetical protein
MRVALAAAVQQRPERVKLLEARLSEWLPVEQHLKDFEVVIALRDIDFSRVDVAQWPD